MRSVTQGVPGSTTCWGMGSSLNKSENSDGDYDLLVEGDSEDLPAIGTGNNKKVDSPLEFAKASEYINFHGDRLVKRYKFSGIEKGDEDKYKYKDGKLTNLESGDAVKLQLQENRWERWNAAANRFYESFRRIDPRSSREVRMGVGKGSRALDLGIAGARTAKFGFNGPAYAFNPNLGHQSGPLAEMRDGDAALSLVSTITTLQYAVTAGTDLLTDKAGKRKALRAAFAHHAGAVACAQAREANRTPTAEESMAFLSFMQATRALAKFNKEASNLRRRRRIGLWRDGPISILPAFVNNARQFGSIFNWSIKATNGLAVASGVGSIANGICYTTEGIFTSQSIARRQKHMRRLLRRFRGALEKGAMKDFAPVLLHHYKRIRRQLRWERGLAISRAVKGAVEISLGIALCTVCILVLTGASFGAAPATILGIALAVWGVMYLISCGIRQSRLWAVEHRSKKRQRMAEQYVALHGRDALVDLLKPSGKAGKTEQPEGDIVPTRYRQRGVVKEAVKSQRFDPLANEYLALEMVTELFLQAADKEDAETDINALWNELPFVNEYQHLVMQELRELINFLRQDRQHARWDWQFQGNGTRLGEAQFWREIDDRQSWMIKRVIAPALGISLRAVGGRQEPAPAIVYTKEFERLYTQAAEKANLSGRSFIRVNSHERTGMFETVCNDMFASGRMSIQEFVDAHERLETGGDLSLVGEYRQERRAFVAWLKACNHTEWRMS